MAPSVAMPIRPPDPMLPIANGRWPVRGELPVLGQQNDITYYASHAASVLNDTRMTGMPYWSVNPYTGCAFGCAYCYARYAHRYHRHHHWDGEYYSVYPR